MSTCRKTDEQGDGTIAPEYIPICTPSLNLRPNLITQLKKKLWALTCIYEMILAQLIIN